MNKATPHEWFERFQAFNPDETREALGLLVDSIKLSPLLRVAKSRASQGAEDRGESQVPRAMISKRTGSCVRCGRGITVGMPIFWRRELGAWHRDCEGSR